MTPDRKLAKAVQVARHVTEPRRGNQHFQNAAVWVTRHWTVEEVIARVAAVSYFAPGTVGVESAASLMFGQSAGNLTAQQAALLATARRRPAALIPWCDRERALREARIILERMVGAGLITRETFQRQETKPTAIRLLPLEVGSCAAH